ncbi:type VI secretion system tube protein TssD [Hymenobacter terrenus]|uniref:type VI secretion system tube protein TssD n=1 Tax=Hymenobacter terrenus TaxID=1629124 RepID=UPI0006194BF2|nr:type VI secretion system tube protein TssD [Hymenobacter terrenus]
MGAIYVELHVDGRIYVLDTCDYSTHQSTHQRGRPNEQVRFGHVNGALPVPNDNFWEGWCQQASQSHEVNILFRDSAGGSIVETLHIPTAHCVGYNEGFDDGTNGGEGNYTAYITLSAPNGFKIAAGGPPAAFIPPLAREHGQPAPVAVPGAYELLPRLPFPDNIPPADWDGDKDLPAYTDEHKEARWAEYQRDKAGNPKMWNKTRWENNYEASRNNNIFGLGREREYRQVMEAESRVFKTAYTYRQIDMYVHKDLYCGQLKTGPIALRKGNVTDLKRDGWLIDEGFAVEYILEKGASKQFLAALSKIGGTYKIGPQIP